MSAWIAKPGHLVLWWALSAWSPAALAQTTPGLPAGPSPAAGAASEAASAPAPAASGASAPDAAASSVKFAPVEPLAPPPPLVVNPPWLDETLPAVPAEGWRYSAALDALGASGQADALRRVLWRRWLSALEGHPPKAAQTVRQALADGETLRPTENDPELRSRWASLVGQQMQVTLSRTAVPVPLELEADAPRLREAAPGLWSMHAPDGTLRGRVWWLQLRHQAPLPMPLAEFRVRAPAGALAMVFDCSLPRYAEMSLALPGRDTAYLCRANAGSGTPAAWDDLARRLRSSATLAAQIEPVDLSGATPVQRVAMRLEAPQKAAADALVAAANTAARAAAQAASAAEVMPAARGASAAAGSAAVRSWADRLRIGGLAVAAVVVFSLMASMAGLRAAIVVSLLLLVGLTLAALFKHLPGLSLLTPWLPKADPKMPLSPLRMAAALGVPLMVTLGLALTHVLLFGERLGLLRGVAGRLADWLSDTVVDRIFHRGRY